MRILTMHSSLRRYPDDQNAMQALQKEKEESASLKAAQAISVSQ